MITLPHPENRRAEYRPYDLSTTDRDLLEALVAVTVPEPERDTLDRSLPIAIVRLVELDGDRYGLHTWHIDPLHIAPGIRSTQSVNPLSAAVVAMLADETATVSRVLTVGQVSS